MPPASIVRTLHLLRRGPAAWNGSRPTTAEPVDLRHVHVRNASLPGADLAGIDFDGATFTNTDMSGASFREARLNGVTMSEVRLDGADLGRAELKGTDLDLASLRDAVLEGAEAFQLKVRRSDLRGVRLGGARLRSSHVYNCDLRGAELGDLDAGTSFKRVVADDDALASLRAQGCEIELANQPLRKDWLDWDGLKLPRRQAGLAHLIYEGRTYWFSEDRSDFFVCHSSEDKDSFVRPLAKALRRRGQRVWFDELEIRAGDRLDRLIDSGIRGANFGVVVVSPSFFGREWTEHEVRRFSKKNVFVVLHGVTPQDLARKSARLGRRLALTSDEGPATVAKRLLEAVSRPPGSL